MTILTGFDTYKLHINTPTIGESYFILTRGVTGIHQRSQTDYLTEKKTQQLSIEMNIDYGDLTLLSGFMDSNDKR